MMKKIKLPKQLKEYIPKNWFWREMISTLGIMFIIGLAIGITVGFLWCYSVNVKPLEAKHENLRKEFHNSYIPSREKNKAVH